MQKRTQGSYRGNTLTAQDSAGHDTDWAARYLGVSKSYLTKLRCTGGGPRFAKYGRRVVYSRADLDAWRERFIVTSTSDAA